jgi:hypothetical protein
MFRRMLSQTAPQPETTPRRILMNWKGRITITAAVCALVLSASTVHARSLPTGPHATLLTAGLDGAIGSTVGPDGALYVAQGTLGRIARVDPRTGAITTFASGLPKQLSVVGLGGVMDVAFIDNTAYALVTLVGSDWGGHDVNGIYQVDGPSTYTVVADIGTFNVQTPPTIPFFIDTPSGVQFALQPYHGGFLVTDGHLNRVLQVTLDGAITVVHAFGDIVPTGLAVRGNTVFMCEAGPIPHQAQDGKVVSFQAKSPTVAPVAAGAPLLVDVEVGSGGSLFALSQGQGSGDPEGSPAVPNTGSLVRANSNGTLTTMSSPLDRPTSLEFIGPTAYVVTLTGQIWKIDGL